MEDLQVSLFLVCLPWCLRLVLVYGLDYQDRSQQCTCQSALRPHYWSRTVPFTFDGTAIIGYTSDPLIPPWFATANTLIGLFIFTILSALSVHYTGALVFRLFANVNHGIL
jgi:hypothetical protein